jgi:hypothetical protein
VATIRTTRPKAMPTIFRLIDFLNITRRSQTRGLSYEMLSDV